MFPLDPQVSPAVPLTAQQPKADYGVSSALRELLEEINETRNLSENLKSGLGISQPEGAENAAQPAGLCAWILEATRSIRKSNSNLGDCLRHLNS